MERAGNKVKKRKMIKQQKTAQNSSYEKIELWTRKVFLLPGRTRVKITETVQGDFQGVTTITIEIANSMSNSYNILKPAPEITIDDIVELKNSVKEYALSSHPLLSRFMRFFGWWFIFAGALSAFSVCPVCGQIGCPIGVGTTGILAGFFALVKQNGKEYFKSIKQKLLKKGNLNNGNDNS